MEVESHSNNRKRKSRTCDSTRISILGAFTSFQAAKTNWIETCVNDHDGSQKTGKPRPLAGIDHSSNSLLKTIRLSTGFHNFKGNLKNNSRGFRENELFCNHLLHVHAMHCSFCYDQNKDAITQCNMIPVCESIGIQCENFQETLINLPVDFEPVNDCNVANVFELQKTSTPKTNASLCYRPKLRGARAKLTKILNSTIQAPVIQHFKRRKLIIEEPCCSIIEELSACEKDATCTEQTAADSNDDTRLDFSSNCQVQHEPLSESLEMNVSFVNSDMNISGAEQSIGNEDDENKSVSSSLSIVETEKLFSLFQKHTAKICDVEDCGKPVTFKKYFKGAVLYISWECKNLSPHKGQWTSTGPYLNLKLASSMLYSGNSFTKMNTFMSLLNLQGISLTSLYQLCNESCYPAVLQFWDSLQVSLLTQCKEPLVISLDARLDSPGFTARLCTLTAIDLKTDKILAIEFAEKSETDRKSVNMEPLCFRRIMEKLTTYCQVAEVVTDGHTQIKKIMRTEYPKIKHSHDIWHAAKNLRKRLTKVSKEKGGQNITEWIGDISNHFWWSAENCERDGDYMRDLWLTSLHHITDEHDWGIGACYHGEIQEQDKTYIEYGSVAYQKLHSVICDKDFLKDFNFYENFRHTGSLESFHSVILSYALKKLPFGVKSYMIRNILAAIDFNGNVNRPIALDKNGSKRYKRKFSKATSKFSVVPVKIPKSTHQIQELMDLTLAKEVVRKNTDMFPMDLEKISLLNTKPECPTKEELIALHMSKSRFAKN